MKVSQLESWEYDPYYAPYIKTLGNVTVLDTLEKGYDSMVEYIKGIPEHKMTYAYAREKWTVAEVLLHLIDAERVFQYRALRFSRNDKTALPGFDQDSYVEESGAGQKTKEQLLEEFSAVRKASIALFASCTDALLLRWGIASGSKVSVRALGCIIGGHQRHHLKILKERYGL